MGGASSDHPYRVIWVEDGEWCVAKRNVRYMGDASGIPIVLIEEIDRRLYEPGCCPFHDEGRRP